MPVWYGLLRRSEARSMLEYALRTRERIPAYGDPAWLLEERSTSTRTNAVESLAMVRASGMRSVALVTSEFHQFRAGKLATHGKLERTLQGLVLDGLRTHGGFEVEDFEHTP
jgi:hypothetical protein